MKRILLWMLALACSASAPEPDVKITTVKAAPSNVLEAGVGIVDVTPTSPALLYGAPRALMATAIDTRLYVKALVFATGGQKVAIVTLDQNKYPVEQANAARRQIALINGIPFSNIIIVDSHTHRAPHWSSYADHLVTPIVQAVGAALRNLAPVTLASGKGEADGLCENRRVIKNNTTWGRWQLPPSQQHSYPTEGPVDPQFIVLGVIGADRRFKAILYDYSCASSNTKSDIISGDYPADVQQYVQSHLYDVPTLYLTGVSGDVNPAHDDALSPVSKEAFGKILGAEILRVLRNLEPVATTPLMLEAWEVQMPAREHPVFAQADILLKWPGQIEHFRRQYDAQKQVERPSYQFFMSGIRIGDNFAIVTSPDDLFTQYRLGIRRQSPFKYTMIVEHTNGDHGYIPTKLAFEGQGYETWYGLHDYLHTEAGDIVEKDSVEMLNHLRN